MFLALEIYRQNFIIMNFLSNHAIKFDNKKTFHTAQSTNYKIETVLDYYQQIDRFFKLLIQQKG